MSGYQPTEEEAAEIAEWLKDGETVLERLKRERHDMLSALELLAGERRLVEKLRAQIAAPPPSMGEVHAYASGRKDEREELVRLLGWAYSRLNGFTHSKQEDALMLDEIKLILMGAE